MSVCLCVSMCVCVCMRAAAFFKKKSKQRELISFVFVERCLPAVLFVFACLVLLIYYFFANIVDTPGLHNRSCVLFVLF